MTSLKVAHHWQSCMTRSKNLQAKVVLFRECEKQGVNSGVCGSTLGTSCRTSLKERSRAQRSYTIISEQEAESDSNEK